MGSIVASPTRATGLDVECAASGSVRKNCRQVQGRRQPERRTMQATRRFLDIAKMAPLLAQALLRHRATPIFLCKPRRDIRGLDVLD